MLYFGRAVDLTLAAALRAMAARQANGTQAVAASVRQLLDYAATHPTPAIRYVASDMILALYTDASYLSELEGKIRAAGHFYMTNHDDEEFKNRGMLTLSAIIKHSMASASEAELAALFSGCKQAVTLRVTLMERGISSASPH